MQLQLGLENIYEFTCYDSSGKLRWREIIHNRIPTQGLNDILNKYLNGSNYTAAWYIGLVSNAGFSAFAATDTAARINGLNGWTEYSGYSGGGRRQLVTASAVAGSVDNSASLATFTFTAAGTLKGGFVVSAQPIGSTSGILYGEGAFAATHTVAIGDVVTVQVTLTAATV